jgi:hypothetical protein
VKAHFRAKENAPQIKAGCTPIKARIFHGIAFIRVHPAFYLRRI